MQQTSRLALPREMVVLGASESAATAGGTDIILILPEGRVAVGLLQVTLAALQWVGKVLLG